MKDDGTDPPSKKGYSQWRNKGKHLPEILQDFHHQKDVFKTMHTMIGEDPKNMSGQEVSWIDGQIYTIDVFLHFMARHGWTLQRSRANVEFESLEKNIAYFKDKEAYHILMQTPEGVKTIDAILKNAENKKD